jgi:ABC-type multidrug transport system permease subunit
MLLLGAVFMPASGLGLSRMPIVFSELSSGTRGFLSNYLFFSLKAFPVVLMAAALDLLLYELADSLISGVLLQFLASVLLAYLSGVFYPLSSLPSAIRMLSPCLPTGQAMLYLRKSLIRGSNVLLPLGYLLAETVVFILLATCLRKRKLSWNHS